MTARLGIYGSWRSLKRRPCLEILMWLWHFSIRSVPCEAAGGVYVGRLFVSGQGGPTGLGDASMSNVAKKFGLAVAVLGLMAATARADLIVSNLNQSGPTVNVTNFALRGLEFNTGDQAYLLTEITAYVGHYTGSPYDPFAELESNNNNAPSGTVLTTLLPSRSLNRGSAPASKPT